MLKLSWRPFAFASYKVFLKKTKRCLELVCLAHFPHDFWRKIFFLLFSITWPNLIAWLLLLCKILGSMCIVIVCWTESGQKFWNKPCLSNRATFSIWPKVNTKIQKSCEWKELLWQNSIFHHFWRAFIEANKTAFLENESPTLITMTAMSKGFNRLQLIIIDCISYKNFSNENLSSAY